MLTLVAAQDPFPRSQMCLRPAMEMKSPMRPKAPLGFLAQEEENESRYCLIPGLPEDVSKICLALVPRSDLRIMGGVSKRWRSVIKSKEFIAVRKETGKLQERVYVLTDDAEGRRWEVLASSENQHYKLPAMPGAAKAGFGVVAMDGKLFVMAGYPVKLGKEYLSDEVHEYDSRLNRWSTVAKMNVARADFACAVLNGKIYAVGGFGARGDFLSSAEVYDAELNKWTLIESIRRPRYDCYACSIGGKLYIMGGRSPLSIGNSRFVDVYDPVARAWTNNKSGSGSSGVTMVTTHAVVGGKLFCMDWKDQRALQAFDPADNSWQKITVPLAGTTAASFCLGTAGGKLLLFSEKPGYPSLQYDPNAPAGSEWRAAPLKPSGACFRSATITA